MRLLSLGSATSRAEAADAGSVAVMPGSSVKTYEAEMSLQWRQEAKMCGEILFSVLIIAVQDFVLGRESARTIAEDEKKVDPMSNALEQLRELSRTLCWQHELADKDEGACQECGHRTALAVLRDCGRCEARAICPLCMLDHNCPGPERTLEEWMQG